MQRRRGQGRHGEMPYRMGSDGPVDHVQIDVIGLQPPQAGLAMLRQRFRRSIRGADLAADEHLSRGMPRPRQPSDVSLAPPL